MKYVIMADGKGKRWNHFQGIQKWQIKIGDQTLLERTCDLIRKIDPSACVYVTSHDPSLQIEGVTRHEPRNNVLEIDRFTAELIEPGVCFLYGDTFYSETALRRIIDEPTDRVLAFGNHRKIFAIKVIDADYFIHHLTLVRELFLNQKIGECIGWEVYHSMNGLPLESREIGPGYVLIEDETHDFNSPDDWMAFQQKNS